MSENITGKMSLMLFQADLIIGALLKTDIYSGDLIARGVIAVAKEWKTDFAKMEGAIDSLSIESGNNA